MDPSSIIKVTSHVSRDFLQNAAYFNTMPKLVWEYVANSLDAAKDGSLVVVAVDITSNYIVISDNGRGMSREELRNFFQMHGENLQRKKGKRVRGRFGTGKSAAFGLANYLKLDTVQNGLRNAVDLSRENIENAKSGEPFPVRDIIVDEPSNAEDGTVITIKDLNVTRPDVDAVISYIEKHLSRYRQRAHVTINGHECRFEESPFVEKLVITPPEDVAILIGNVELILKVSPIPLDEEVRGIDILSYGIWHGTTLAGVEKKEKANYIFGQVDVPILEDKEWPIPAFDNTRNNTLNHQNPAVAVLLGWLYEEIEKVRQYLVEKEREKKRTEEARQLAKEAEKIADILNEDFLQQEIELELSRRVSKRSGGKSVSELLDEQGELWPGDGNQVTSWEETGANHGTGSRSKLGGDGNNPRPGPTARPGSDQGAKKSTQTGNSKRRRAVFNIEYENATSESPRSRYDKETKTIFINLDHPQIATAYEVGGRSTEGKQFRQICYEVAAVEYAIAYPSEKLEQDEFYQASDALFDVRDTINRVTRRFVQIM